MNSNTYKYKFHPIITRERGPALALYNRVAETLANTRIRAPSQDQVIDRPTGQYRLNERGGAKVCQKAKERRCGK